MWSGRRSSGEGNQGSVRIESDECGENGYVSLEIIEYRSQALIESSICLCLVREWPPSVDGWNESIEHLRMGREDIAVAYLPFVRLPNMEAH